MKFIASIPSLFLLAASTLAISVSFDPVYDNSSMSSNTVSCSTFLNNIESTTFGGIPDFPNIGGAQAVADFDSANCGTWWALTFNGSTINVLAIDKASAGFNIAQQAMGDLTHEHAVLLGRIEAIATQVPASSCGLD